MEKCTFALNSILTGFLHITATMQEILLTVTIIHAIHIDPVELQPVVPDAMKTSRLTLYKGEHVIMHALLVLTRTINSAHTSINLGVSASA